MTDREREVCRVLYGVADVQSWCVEYVESRDPVMYSHDRNSVLHVINFPGNPQTSRQRFGF